MKRPTPTSLAAAGASRLRIAARCEPALQPSVVAVPEGAVSGFGRPGGSDVRTLLRQATRDDIAQIQRVRHAVRENRLTSGVIRDGEVLEHLEQLGRGWVIEVDGVVRAFAIGNKGNGNVWALFVERGHEQRGHGRRLHDTMMAWFWAEGVPRVWLSTGPHTRADAFYRAAGWVDAGLTAHGEVRFEMARPAGA